MAKRLTTWARDRGVVGSNPDNIFSPVLGWWDKCLSLQTGSAGGQRARDREPCGAFTERQEACLRAVSSLCLHAVPKPTLA